jgi:hypothetical protein
MGKNIWLIGILVLVLIIQVLPLSQIEGFDREQLHRSEMADQLYLMVFLIILIISISIGYVVHYLVTGSLSDDLKKNIKNNQILSAAGTILTNLIKAISNFPKIMGIFCFLLFILAIVLYAVGKEYSHTYESMGNIFIFVIFGLLYYNIHKIKDLLNNIWIHRIIFIVMLLFIIIGPIYQITILTTTSILLLIFLFLIYSDVYKDLYNKILLFIRGLSFTILFCILFSLFINGLLYSLSINSGNFGSVYNENIQGYVLLSLVLAYLLGFIIHFIYFHGFNYKFLGIFNPPVMDLNNLKKSPIYIFCEGILFEPFYKFDFLKNRRVINKWHKGFNDFTSITKFHPTDV